MIFFAFFFYVSIGDPYKFSELVLIEVISGLCVIFQHYFYAQNKVIEKRSHNMKNAVRN